MEEKGLREVLGKREGRGRTGRQMFSKGEGHSPLGLPGHREEEWPWVHLPVNADFVNLPHYFSVALTNQFFVKFTEHLLVTLLGVVPFGATWD